MSSKGVYRVQRGNRVMVDGIEYAVTHVKADGKRGEIALISIDEARRRRDDLEDLLR